MADHPEIGRELLANELKPRTVVVTRLSTRMDTAITLWVKDVDDKIVWLYAGELELNVILSHQPDGTLRDSHARQVHVYDYLGKICEDESGSA